jgi:molybdenum cofactor biosynthesis protein B
MSYHDHRGEGPQTVRLGILTASDTRGEAEDVSGAWLRKAAAAAGHPVVYYRVVKDEPDLIREALTAAVEAEAQVVIVNGGTGIAMRDRTFETVTGLLEKRLDGFGELFRMLSFAEVGSAAMMSRATAGIWRGCVLMSVPGATPAVRLAWEKLIAPELSHLVRELRKDAPGHGGREEGGRPMPPARADRPGMDACRG